MLRARSLRKKNDVLKKKIFFAKMNVIETFFTTRFLKPTHLQNPFKDGRMSFRFVLINFSTGLFFGTFRREISVKKLFFLLDLGLGVFSNFQNWCVDSVMVGGIQLNFFECCKYLKATFSPLMDMHPGTTPGRFQCIARGVPTLVTQE